MTKGSISAAADAMNVTQSAVSKQLSQLRNWLDDDLFIRTNEGMKPTPRALALREQIESILEQAAELTAEEHIPPEEFTGSFVISATDEVLQRITHSLVDRVSKNAPALRLVTLPLMKDYLVRQLEAGQVNLVVAVNWHAPESLMQKKLDSDPFVCVMHQNHPLARGNLTLKRYADAIHVLVAPLGNAEGVVDLELQRHGLRRQVCASVSSFSLLSEKLLGEERITTVPSKVAKGLAKQGRFTIKSVPLKLPPTNYYALWHPRFSAEPRLRWMLDLIITEFENG